MNEMQQCLKNDDSFNRPICNADCLFHFSGKVNRRNRRVLGSQSVKETLQHIRDSPRVNVFYPFPCKDLRAVPPITIPKQLTPPRHEDSNILIFVKDIG